LYCSTYSPDGRIFQVEYAQKAVENSGNVVAFKTKDGIVMAVEKYVTSKMLVEGTNRRIFSLDDHAGIAFSGIAADGRALANRGREECNNYKGVYGENIPSKHLSDRIANYMHVFTQYWHARPFGISCLLASVDKSGVHLHSIDPSGQCYEFVGMGAGKGRQAAKTEIEKLDLANLSSRDGLFHAAKIIETLHDDAKDKPYELEMSWICPETEMKHKLVSRELVKEVREAAKRAIEAEEDEDEDEDE